MVTTVDLASIPPPPPRPRRVRRRRGYYQIGMYHLLLVFLFPVACTFWQIAAGVVQVIWFSTIVPAQVTKVLVIPGERGPSHEIAVAYRFGEAEYSDNLRVSSREAEFLKEGDAVRVQVLPERPERAHLYYEHYPSRFVTVFICLTALMPTIGLARILWELYVVPWKLRALLRRGEATTGVIVDKKEIPGRVPTYTITYEYQALPAGTAEPETCDGAAVKASMKVQADDFQTARVGDRVAVLYHPQRPRTSVLCHYADYEFVPP